jgi:2-isopropylmalate synthase
MKVDPANKYRAFPPVQLPDRRWPERSIQVPPTWCSVDLRDGNQALVEPMDAARKLRMFETLVDMGFREIEVGFPSSSETDFAFTRQLIEEGRIPEHVTIQVLTQARPELIDRTMESIRGARRAIAHLYNSTSPVQRDVVFGVSRAGCREMAVAGVERIKALAARMPATEVVLEYSPESFTATELDFALEICEAVMDVWGPTAAHPIILNLPATVEMATPNVYADQIEWFHRNLRDRDAVVLSLHPHNDRGTAVGATELGLMAGADRVEGTLFGNGERTGNVDIITLALNLWTQGIHPGLRISDIDALVRTAEHCNRLPVHPRHPYAGELVYTAFAGSHQDAIKKGFEARRERGQERWEVPYLPMDPADVGRTYQTVIRINSQSGKGGIAYLLERDYELRLPRTLQVEFREHVQAITDASGEELPSEGIWDAFQAEYLHPGRIEVASHRVVAGDPAAGAAEFEFAVQVDGRDRVLRARGNGPIDAFATALQVECDVKVGVVDYSEHALGRGADARAVAYVQVATPDGLSRFGVGMHANLVTASLRAVASAVNRVRS